MDQTTLGSTIKNLREKAGLTQLQFAEKLNVSDKAVSKWETGRGFPDISFMETIASILQVSVAELFTCNPILNTNKKADVKKTKFYVCPICGNVIMSTGETVLNCCAVQLYPLDAEPCDEKHLIEISKVEDELYVNVNHEMTKDHYISFMAFVSYNSVQFVKLYPEQQAQTRFKIRGKGKYLHIVTDTFYFQKKFKKNQAALPEYFTSDKVASSFDKYIHHFLISPNLITKHTAAMHANQN